MRNTLPKMLAAVEAAEAMAFQYKGMLEWFEANEEECPEHQPPMADTGSLPQGQG
jgi:hypothetical protein